MIRCVQLGRKWYGIELDEVANEEADNIEQFVSEGNAVLFVPDTESFDELGLLDSYDEPEKLHFR